MLAPLPPIMARAFAPAFSHAGSVNTTSLVRRGPELAVNGDFSAGAAGWTLGDGWAVQAGQLVATAAPQDSMAFTTAGLLTAGKWYDIQVECTAFTAGNWKLLLEGGMNVFGDQSAAGKFRATVQASVDGNIYLWVNAPLTASFDNLSVRQLLGRT